MVEADIHLRLLHISIVDIYKVFETLVCCLEGISLHPYAITLAKLATDLGIQVHLRSGNDVTTSWLRLRSTSHHLPKNIERDILEYVDCKKGTFFLKLTTC